MSDIAPLGHFGVDQSAPVAPTGHRLTPGETTRVRSTRDTDRVEVSALANYLSLLREIEPYRPGLVDRVRGEIESGSYESSERLDLAVETLVDEEPGLFE